MTMRAALQAHRGVIAAPIFWLCVFGIVLGVVGALLN
jgi:hypothetical protein